MGAFILGLFIGANLGIIISAMLVVSKKDRFYGGISECCNGEVQIIPEYRCVECGKFCKLKEEE
jgi:hypothetical protein